MMKPYVILMRGINVGGKNKIPMAALKQCLEDAGFEGVTTYIQSGNVILRSPLGAEAIQIRIEALLPQHFTLDSATVKIVAYDSEAYKGIVTGAPAVFGDDSSGYRCNVLFLMNYEASEAMKQIETRGGVDEVWQGEKALYFRNSLANASKSRLSKIVGQPFYPFVTIRNWNTTRKLLELLEAHKIG